MSVQHPRATCTAHQTGGAKAVVITPGRVRRAARPRPSDIFSFACVTAFSHVLLYFHAVQQDVGGMSHGTMVHTWERQAGSAFRKIRELITVHSVGFTSPPLSR